MRTNQDDHHTTQEGVSLETFDSPTGILCFTVKNGAVFTISDEMIMEVRIDGTKTKILFRAKPHVKIKYWGRKDVVK